METSEEARKIIQESANQNGIEEKIILTNKNIYELARKNVLEVEFFWTKEEIIQKLIEIATEKKKTGKTKPLILTENWYIDVHDQNEVNKSVENYHKLNTSSAIFNILAKYYTTSKNETIINFLKDPSKQPSIDLMKAMQIIPGEAVNYIGATIKSTAPKIGLAFRTYQKSIIAVTWKNLGEGLKRFQEKTYEINFQDKKVYAGDVKATIKNKENNTEYQAIIKSAFIKSNQEKDVYRYAWTPEIWSTSEDAYFKGGTQKQKASFQFGTKDLVAMLHAAHKHFYSKKNNEVLGAFTSINNFFPTPNKSYLNLVDVVDKVLVINATKENRTLLKANETLQNQLIDAIIQKYGATKFFEKH